jgi:hypothetical protein
VKGVYHCYTENMYGRISKVQYQTGDNKLTTNKSKMGLGKYTYGLVFDNLHKMEICHTETFHIFILMNKSNKLCQSVYL